MMMDKISNLKEKGFTLIEMLASIGIFSILMVVLSGIFLSAMQSQIQIAYTQYLINDANYALDYMGRAIRMAQRDTDGGCVGTSRYGFLPSSGVSSTITFLDYNSKCHKFYLESGKVKEVVSATKYSSGFASAPIDERTSEKSNVLDLKFNIRGGTDSDDKQPFITIMMKSQANTQNTESLPFITVQTSVSQRNLDK
jgi:prepilin-type N-terminal cleavage/methylation domain-containing protein